ncbi:TetR family transcriptional regulator [Rhodospirillum rubrum]|uniref:TetR family transcriptional regulator n=1 Tax=Rhodospirillum rubrum TaxID=1085 RepID=UPI001F5C0A71|nr:TetR family transcriptional regulator [Rhodospirillum rubrum]
MVNANDESILDAALRAIALSGWSRGTLAGIAADAGLSLADLLRLYPTRAALLEAWGRSVDFAMLAEGTATDPGESARDRLFELLMRRFDALAPHKETLRALLPSFGGDPTLALTAGMGLGRSAALTLEAAGLSAAGLRGLLRVKGLSAVYLYTLRAWLGDDTTDMAHTMAALDKALDQAEALANTVFRQSAATSSRSDSGIVAGDDAAATI